MELYHGSRENTNGLVMHEGICLTDSPVCAEAYAETHRGGSLYQVELDLATLRVEEVPGFDHDSADCPADHEEFRAQSRAEGVDVLLYEDEDERGRVHDCYRLISKNSLACVQYRQLDEDEIWSLT